MKLNEYIAQLIEYAKKYLELSLRDEVYARNRVMDILGVYDQAVKQNGYLSELL